MIQNQPQCNYLYYFAPSGYVHQWRRRNPKKKHYSIAPERNRNGFHITEYGKHVYYNRFGRKRTNRLHTATKDNPEEWQNNADLMAAYLAKYRRV